MERWLPIVGYEGLYEVSDLGRVRTVPRLVPSARSTSGLRRVPARIRSTKGLLNGYPAVNLSKNGKTQMRSVHTMVLEAFVGPRPSAMHEGCHGDGNRMRSELSNLRWGTKAENKADTYLHGTAIYGERAPTAKLNRFVVASALRDPRSAAAVARDLGVCAITIRRARSGETWSRALAELRDGNG